jgi:twitching motility protein PilJ
MISMLSTEYGPVRLGLIVTMSLTAIVTAAILYFLFSSISEQAGDASVINVSGRQRMLTQKMSKEALVAVNTTDPKIRAAFLKNLAGTSSMFDRSYKALVDGGVFPTGQGDSERPLPPTKDAETRKQMVDEVGTRWSAFKKHADTILDERATLEEQQAALDQIIATNVDLLKNMNAAVQMYDGAATARNDATSNIITIAVVVALLLMTTTAVLIFLINHALSKAGLESEEAQSANMELQENIVDLLEVVSEAAEGDLQVRARVSEGALGNVADAVNQMIESWSKVLEETTVVASDMEENLQVILASSQDVASDAERQSDRIVQTNELMTSLVQELTTVQDSANSASVAADETRNSAEEGSRSIQQVIQAMQQLQSNVQEGAKKIKGLGDRSMEITNIVSTIAKISEQTNMLALNAAIEAARAGEEGRGFSVVADQVQRLAEQTAEATEEIGELVRFIQEDAGASVQAIDEQSLAVEQESQNVSAAGLLLTQIVSASRESSNVVTGINNIAASHASSFNSLVGEFGEIQRISTENQKNSTKNLEICRNLMQKSSNLMQNVRSFKVA